MFENLRRDIARNSHDGRWFTNPGFWIVAVHRLGMWAHSLPVILRVPMWVLYRLFRLPFFFYHVQLWAGRGGAHVGPGLRLIHPTNVMIGGNVEIGEDCIIFHDVTLGKGPVPGTPKIGNRVDIYPGARVLGGIAVGDRSMIGANCVVTRNIPPDSVVVAAPFKMMPRSLSPLARGADRGGAATEAPTQ